MLIHISFSDRNQKRPLQLKELTPYFLEIIVSVIEIRSGHFNYPAVLVAGLISVSVIEIRSGHFNKL